MARKVSNAELSGARVKGRLRLGWMNSGKVASVATMAVDGSLPIYYYYYYFYIFKTFRW